MAQLDMRRTMEEADAIAASLAELCQTLRERLGHGAQPYGRADTSFLLDEVTSGLENASHYLAELRPTLERLTASLRAIETEHGRLTTLYGISHTLNSTLDLEELLNIVMDRIVDILRAERGFLMLTDDRTQQLDFKVARNMSRETIAESSFQVSRSIIDRVVAEAKPVLTTNAQADPRFSTQASVVGFSLRSILCVPLIAKSRMIGVVYVDNRIMAGLFGQKELDLLVAFANQAAIAIENARLFESMINTMNEIARMSVIKDTFERVVAKPVVDRLLSSPPKLGGEKQIVTVLFADIRGYTAFAEHISPEELLGVLNRYLAFTTKAILKQEGTVDKFLGDGIMAFFNAPLSQPDHALRGARAAIEIIRQVDDYNAQAGAGSPQLSFGIGLNTGEAIVGNIGAAEIMNYTVIGDAVNVARRLQESARPGQILLSENTYELIKETAEVRSKDLITVRGRNSPIPAYQLLNLGA